ncbi:MAG: hypothetical protein ACKVP7_27730 [Hyphomicrobiaceae bacterium]
MQNSVLLQERLQQLQVSRERVKADTTASATAEVEARLEQIFDQMYFLAMEVALTPMPSYQGLSCKATYLLEYLEQSGGDFASELARSLATDVLAVSQAAVEHR